MKNEWLVLSLVWSRNRSDYLVWYTQGARGYTENIEQAGRFTEGEARGHAAGEGLTAMVREADARALAVTHTLVPAGEGNILRLTSGVR